MSKRVISFLMVLCMLFADVLYLFPSVEAKADTKPSNAPASMYSKEDTKEVELDLPYTYSPYLGDRVRFGITPLPKDENKKQIKFEKNFDGLNVSSSAEAYKGKKAQNSRNYLNNIDETDKSLHNANIMVQQSASAVKGRYYTAAEDSKPYDYTYEEGSNIVEDNVVFYGAGNPVYENDAWVQRRYKTKKSKEYNISNKLALSKEITGPFCLSGYVDIRALKAETHTDVNIEGRKNQGDANNASSPLLSHKYNPDSDINFADAWSPFPRTKYDVCGGRIFQTADGKKTELLGFGENVKIQVDYATDECVDYYIMSDYTSQDCWGAITTGLSAAMSSQPAAAVTVDYTSKSLRPKNGGYKEAWKDVCNTIKGKVKTYNDIAKRAYKAGDKKVWAVYNDSDARYDVLVGGDEYTADLDSVWISDLITDTKISIQDAKRAMGYWIGSGVSQDAAYNYSLNNFYEACGMTGCTDAYESFFRLFCMYVISIIASGYDVGSEELNMWCIALNELVDIRKNDITYVPVMENTVKIQYCANIAQDPDLSLKSDIAPVQFGSSVLGIGGGAKSPYEKLLGRFMGQDYADGALIGVKGENKKKKVKTSVVVSVNFTVAQYWMFCFGGGEALINGKTGDAEETGVIATNVSPGTYGAYYTVNDKGEFVQRGSDEEGHKTAENANKIAVMNLNILQRSGLKALGDNNLYNMMFSTILNKKKKITVNGTLWKTATNATAITSSTSRDASHWFDKNGNYKTSLRPTSKEDSIFYGVDRGNEGTSTGFLSDNQSSVESMYEIKLYDYLFGLDGGEISNLTQRQVKEDTELNMVDMYVGPSSGEKNPVNLIYPSIKDLTGQTLKEHPKKQPWVNVPQRKSVQEALKNTTKISDSITSSEKNSKILYDAKEVAICNAYKGDALPEINGKNSDTLIEFMTKVGAQLVVNTKKYSVSILDQLYGSLTKAEHGSQSWREKHDKDGDCVTAASVIGKIKEMSGDNRNYCIAFIYEYGLRYGNNDEGNPTFFAYKDTCEAIKSDIKNVKKKLKMEGTYVEGKVQFSFSSQIPTKSPNTVLKVDDKLVHDNDTATAYVEKNKITDNTIWDMSGRDFKIDDSADVSPTTDIDSIFTNNVEVFGFGIAQEYIKCSSEKSASRQLVSITNKIKDTLISKQYVQTTKIWKDASGAVVNTVVTKKPVAMEEDSDSDEEDIVSTETSNGLICETTTDIIDEYRFSVYNTTGDIVETCVVSDTNEAKGTFKNYLLKHEILTENDDYQILMSAGTSASSDYITIADKNMVNVRTPVYADATIQVEIGKKKTKYTLPVTFVDAGFIPNYTYVVRDENGSKVQKRLVDWASTEGSVVHYPGFSIGDVNGYVGEIPDTVYVSAQGEQCAIAFRPFLQYATGEFKIIKSDGDLQYDQGMWGYGVGICQTFPDLPKDEVDMKFYVKSTSPLSNSGAHTLEHKFNYLPDDNTGVTNEIQFWFQDKENGSKVSDFITTLKNGCGDVSGKKYKKGWQFEFKVYKKYGGGFCNESRGYKTLKYTGKNSEPLDYDHHNGSRTLGISTTKSSEGVICTESTKFVVTDASKISDYILQSTPSSDTGTPKTDGTKKYGYLKLSDSLTHALFPDESLNDVYKVTFKYTPCRYYTAKDGSIPAGAVRNLDGGEKLKNTTEIVAKCTNPEYKDKIYCKVKYSREGVIYYLDGTRTVDNKAWTEIKEGAVPLNEQWEAMSGMPTTKAGPLTGGSPKTAATDIYWTVGGTIYKASVSYHIEFNKDLGNKENCNYLKIDHYKIWIMNGAKLDNAIDNVAVINKDMSIPNTGGTKLEEKLVQAHVDGNTIYGDTLQVSMPNGTWMNIISSSYAWNEDYDATRGSSSEYALGAVQIQTNNAFWTGLSAHALTQAGATEIEYAPLTGTLVPCVSYNGKGPDVDLGNASLKFSTEEKYYNSGTLKNVLNGTYGPYTVTVKYKTLEGGYNKNKVKIVANGDVSTSTRANYAPAHAKANELVIHNPNAVSMTRIPNNTDNDSPLSPRHSSRTTAYATDDWIISYNNTFDTEHPNKTQPYDQRVKDDSGSSKYYTTKNHIFIDYDFAFMLSFVDDFTGGQQADTYGILNPTSTTGLGYTTALNTAPWIQKVEVKFPFDVIYNETAVAANTWIDLGDPGLESTKIYTGFHIPLKTHEVNGANVEVRVTATNIAYATAVAGDSNYENELNYVVPYRSSSGANTAARHGAKNKDKLDIVGHIGALTMLDNGDFRYSEYFKKKTGSGWLVDNLIENTDASKQEGIVNTGQDVLRKLIHQWDASTADDKDVYKTLPTLYNTISQDTALPLTGDVLPSKLKDNAKGGTRLGYSSYMSVETVGDYYGKLDGGIRMQTEVAPRYWYATGAGDTWKPVNVWVNIGGKYRLINSNKKSEFATAEDKYQYFIKMDWTNEKERRMFTGSETTNGAYGPYDEVIINSGVSNYLWLRASSMTNIGDSTAKEQAQRWHFSLGLPSGSVFVEPGKNPNKEPEAILTNVQIMESCRILSIGDTWTLMFDGMGQYTDWTDINPPDIIPWIPYPPTPDPPSTEPPTPPSTEPPTPPSTEPPTPSTEPPYPPSQPPVPEIPEIPVKKYTVDKSAASDLQLQGTH